MNDSYRLRLPRSARAETLAILTIPLPSQFRADYGFSKAGQRTRPNGKSAAPWHLTGRADRRAPG